MSSRPDLEVVRFPKKPSAPRDSTKYLNWFHCHVEYEGRGTFEWGFFEAKLDAVAVLAVREDGCIGFVRQFRYPVGTHCIELVKGFAAKGEAPLEAAQRELKEELAVGAGRWDALGRLASVPGIGRVDHHCFLARDLYAVPAALDPSEPPESLEAIWVSRDRVIAHAAWGSIADAVTLATVLLAASKELDWS